MKVRCIASLASSQKIFAPAVTRRKQNTRRVNHCSCIASLASSQKIFHSARFAYFVVEKFLLLRLLVANKIVHFRWTILLTERSLDKTSNEKGVQRLPFPFESIISSFEVLINRRWRCFIVKLVLLLLRLVVSNLPVLSVLVVRRYRMCRLFLLLLSLSYRQKALLSSMDILMKSWLD